MTETRRRPGTNRAGRWRVAAIATFQLLLSAGPARAQFGYGGFGIGFPQPIPLDTEMLNSWALNNGSAAAANRPQPLTAPRFQGRDDAAFTRYDLATHTSMINQIARNPARELRLVSPSGAGQETPPPRTPRPVAAEQPRPVAAEQPRPAVLLANFFDRSGALGWPINAPITGGLGKKQEVADRAILAVLREYETRGIALMLGVTEARERLLEYGRPALDLVRKESTPAIADSFHSFLLGLYAQVGLAGTVPKAP